MASYSIHLMLASLHIEDTPIFYNSPVGPSTDLKLVYNQREENQPATCAFTNFGPKWTSNWLSYVTDDPANESADATVYVRGGGSEVFSNYNPTTQSYEKDKQTLAVLVRTAPRVYEKRFPDGSKEVFSKSDNSGLCPQRIFLTGVVDASGHTTTLSYDATLRITGITDWLGQTTALEYALAGDSFKVTKITDPFGRFAMISYTNGQLTKITDPVGIQSEFIYYPGTDFISTMRTPYGDTMFDSGEDGNAVRWLEATDPRGGKERVEYNNFVSTLPASEALAPLGVYNNDLNRWNTFYWDKKAMADGPGDYTKAKVIHWLASPLDTKVSGIKHSEKLPLESRMWYAYAGQDYGGKVGTDALPTRVARMLDDGSTQQWQYEYSNIGRITKSIDPQTDPVGRTTTYEYYPNQIDLKNVYQERPGGSSIDPYQANADRITHYTYASDPLHPHLVESVTDAANQTTVNTYNSNGQITDVQNARNETTHYEYGTATSACSDVPSGYLISVTSPTFNGQSTVTNLRYDCARRVQTVTNNPDNYTVTMDYDNLDRPTQRLYPDGTTEQFKYTEFTDAGVDTGKKLLDLTQSKDRDNRWTYRHYDGNRHMDWTKDPLLRKTIFDWCTCGSLVGITDPKGNVTTFNRDLQQRVYQKIFSDNSAIIYVYENTTSRLHSMTDALNQTASYSYYADDNVHQVTYSNAQNPTPNVTYGYDPDYNRISSMVDGTGTTNFTYYPVLGTPTINDGKLYQVDGPLSNDTITYTYDELGRVHTRDINGSTQTMDYDSLGRLTTTANALGSFSRAYESVTPRLHTLTYPNGQTATYDYFGNTFDRRLQTLQNNTAGAVNLSQHDYTYDAVGQIHTWARTLGQNQDPLAFDYDDAQQLASVYQGNQQTDYQYDEAGNKVEDWIHQQHLQGAGGVKTIYTANNLNQLDSVSTQEGNSVPSDPLAITYDLNGNMTYDGGNQTYEWDAANRLVAINYIDSGNRTEFAYDGMGRRVKITEYGPGVTATVQPSGSSYTSFTTAPFTLPAGSYKLTFAGLNPNGGNNIALIDSVALNNTLMASGSFEAPVTSNFQGAPTGTAWNYFAPAGIAHNGGSYTSDNPNAPDGTQVAFVKNTGLLSQIWSASAGTYTLSFKAAQRGSGNDSYQQLRVNLRPSGAVVSTKKFVWCENQICEERNTSNSVTKRFLSEGEERIGGSDAGNYYYSHDHLGSVREVTDSAGALKARYDYDAWGKSVVVSGNMNVDFGYTGHYFHQPSGLDLAMYRAYSPSLGRWLSRDPMENAETALGPNLYVYVRNRVALN